MGDVVRFKRPSQKDKARGRTLCSRGFHKWVIDQNKQFDVKQGRLVTIHRCKRCGEMKTTAI
ncbi:MAG: hypothetical protein PVF57_09185 [Pseudomonadales bacterium]